jgi:hypothetical protein
MAAVAVIVAAIARSSWRDLRSIGSIAGNNVLAVIALMMWNEPANKPSSTSFFLLIIGALFLFPLSADVLRHMPSDRLRLWPLSPKQRVAIGLATLLLNPMLLITVLFTSLSRNLGVGIFLLLATGAVQIVFAATERLLHHLPHWNLLRYIPCPPGRLGSLIQSQMRQLMGALDVYFAMVITTGGTIYRFFAANPDPMATTVLGLIVVIFLSTLAQCQFGFDSAAEMDRYRLMPLSGVQILFAKDIAWIIVALVLTCTFDVVPCIAAAASALAVGHRTAAQESIQQRRWRFASGKLTPTGVFQIVALVSTGVAVHQFGPLLLVPFVAAYCGSLWWYGRDWERRVNY